MDDLRTEIRDAFEREQAAHPAAANLRYRVVRETASRPAPNANLQWMAVAAALLIGALVVVGLMSSRVAVRPAPATTPHPTSSAIPDYGPPPAGVPLLYVGDPNHPGWYVGFDWNGVPRGTIKLEQAPDELRSLVQAPDGSGFLLDAGGKETSGQTLDRLGKAQEPFPVPTGTRQLVWADDNRHLCSLAIQNGNVVLSWHVPTYTANAAILGKQNGPDNLGYAIRGCSFATDQRAVIEHDLGGGIPQPKEFLVVGLGDGRVLAREPIAPGVANGIVVSHDGTLVALNSLKSDGFPEPTAAHTVVRELSSGSRIDLDPSLGVLAFSGDDKVALVTTGWFAGRPTNLQAIELATGKVLWSYAGGQELAGYLAEPDSGNFALMLKQTGTHDLHPKVSILIERAGGTSTAVPGSFSQP